MRQVMVELDDQEMAKLEALARQSRVEPAELLKAAAFKGLTNNGRPMVLKGRYVNWKDLRAIFREKVTASAASASDIPVAGDNGKSEFLITETQLRQFPAFLMRRAARARPPNFREVADSGVVAIDSVAVENEAKEERRRARLAVLMRSSGIFKGDPGKPKDGLIYQNELRAEWQ